MQSKLDSSRTHDSKNENNEKSCSAGDNGGRQLKEVRRKRGLEQPTERKLWGW
jgi:hypothetical protein